MENKIHSLHIICAFVLLAVGCRNTDNKASAFQSVDNKTNELLIRDADGNEINRLKNISLEGTNYEVLYKPLAYVISKGHQVEPTIENIRQYGEQYDGLVYFDLRISHNEIKGDLLKSLADDGGHYEKLIKYCSFGIQRDLKLVTTSGDTIPCATALFERTYGMIPGITILTAFVKPEKLESDLTLVFNDKIFQKGPLKFVFKASELQEPELQ